MLQNYQHNVLWHKYFDLHEVIVIVSVIANIRLYYIRIFIPHVLKHFETVIIL